MDQEKIQKQAKKIMDDFIKALEKQELSEFSITRKKSLRDQEKYEVDKDFKDNWLKIVPKKKDRYLVAEKGHWK